MKIKVVVVVYNRYENIEKWIKCWKLCNTENSELIIVHNDNGESDKFKQLCENNNIAYIKRKNVGYDIGVYQDIFKERLEGFDNNWDYIICCSDDCLPMKKDFIQQFINKFNSPSVGCVCLEISREIKTHIRTTGFCLKKEVSKKIVFLVDPITSKLDCYKFEHRTALSLYEQIINLNLSVVMINNLRLACMWDIGNRAILNRWEDFKKEFSMEKNNEKIVFIATIYNSYPEILGSLLNQTYKNWELLLIHDGKNETGLSKIIDNINDSRIKFIETEHRLNQYGHPIRKWALENLNLLVPDCNYVVITNSDNHYVPHFCEYMLKGFNNPEIIATYCSSFTHAYESHQPDGVYKYGVLQTKLQLGWIDCGMVMIKKDIAIETGWDDMTHSSDWVYFNKIITKYGKNKWAKVLGNLFVHN